MYNVNCVALLPPHGTNSFVPRKCMGLYLPLLRNMFVHCMLYGPTQYPGSV